jgi:hypothetical protein
MSHDIPGLGKLVCSVLGDPDWSQFGKGPELGTASRSSLQPDDEGDSLIWDCDAVCVCPEEAVVHSGLTLGVVPIDLFVASVRKYIPE